MNTWLIAIAKGADHYEDQLYFTFIWENTEILYSVGNGDAKNELFWWLKCILLCVFTGQIEHIIQLFPQLQKKRQKSAFIIEIDFVEGFWTNSLASWAMLQLLSLLQCFRYQSSISICFRCSEQFCVGQQSPELRRNRMWGLLGQQDKAAVGICCQDRGRKCVHGGPRPSWGDSLSRSLENAAAKNCFKAAYGVRRLWSCRISKTPLATWEIGC